MYFPELPNPHAIAALALTVLALVLFRNSPRPLVVLIVSLVIIDIFIVGAWFGLEKVQKRIMETRIETEQRIEAAVAAGAEEHSPVELRFAREKLAEARKGMEERYNQPEKSIYLIEQSEINSELAIEKSRTAVMRRSVGDAMRENEVLREDYLATYGEDFE